MKFLDRLRVWAERTGGVAEVDERLVVRLSDISD